MIARGMLAYVRRGIATRREYVDLMREAVRLASPAEWSEPAAAALLKRLLVELGHADGEGDGGTVAEFLVCEVCGWTADVVSPLKMPACVACRGPMTCIVVNERLGDQPDGIERRELTCDAVELRAPDLGAHGIGGLTVWEGPEGWCIEDGGGDLLTADQARAAGELLAEAARECDRRSRLSDT